MSKKNLVIVESPAKAKTIEKFLGSDYRVLSSQGHIRDIEGSGKNSIGIDFDHNYAPNYVIDPLKTQLLTTLRKASSEAETIWLASDEDREGEAIAWHLKEVLNLPDDKTRRIVFHEITKTAIQEAIAHPRDIDYNLVNAQQTRRLIDRIVGYELSPVLWRKITTGLSAGRVQSVAVRLIVEREREIEAFNSTPQYRIIADFIGTNPYDASVLRAELNKRFAIKKEALAFLELCKTATFKVAAVSTKPAKHSPAPPFTTSSLQQEAARKLKYSVSKTMRIAQSLYEAGHITYMRTDSVNLSSLAIGTCKQEILDEFGEKYHCARQFHTSSKGAQEAHEAIRPTYMSTRKAGANVEEQRLYELIWKRTIASQMADAEVEQTRIDVAISTSDKLFFSASGEVVLFDGFMRAYIQSTDDQDEEKIVLPKMAVNESLKFKELVATEVFTKPPFRYTEASLVKKMEELGIGRPSTYATIIETILNRQYVVRGTMPGTKRDYNILTLKGDKITDKTKSEMAGADTQKLLPTDLGRVTNDFLVEQFPTIMNYDFTAKEEEKFDEVAVGKADWIKTVDTFYKTFHPVLLTIPAGKVQGRLLGTYPATGEPVIARISKSGPCIQLGDSKDEKPRFVSLQPGQSIYTITLDEALKLFEKKFPYELGELEGQKVLVGDGKYGAYIHIGDAFVSIPKSINPMNITLEQAAALYAKHQQDQLPIAVFGDILVLNGRYGPYIKTPTGNFRIPRSVDATKLTEEDCKKLIYEQEGAEKTAKRTFRRKK